MTYTVEQKSQLARLMATENLRVEHQKIQTAMFDPKNRVLYLPIWQNMTGDLYDLLCGHEVGHALHTPAEGWHKAALDPSKPQSYKHFLNVIEDIRIEKKIKRKYPGLRLPFLMAYKELNDKDFFGIKSKDINTFPFIDRLNIYMKTHYNMGTITFNKKEKDFVKRSEETETWEEVVSLTNEIFNYSREEQKQLEIQDHQEYKFYSYGDSDSDSDSDLDEDFYFEEDDESDENYDSSFNETLKKGSFGNDEQEGDDTDGFGNPQNSNEDDGDSFDNEQKHIVREKESKDYQGKGDYVPVCVTDETFREKENFLVDEKSKNYVYLSFPKPDLKSIITPYKIVHKSIKDYYSIKHSYASIIDKKVRDFKNKNSRFIDLLVKEFEMRKAAKSYNKAKIANTGEINISKLSNYKFDDNMFKKIMSIPKGKNHGLILLLDKSGSMNTHLPGSIEQILVLSMFCKKVNIPFIVYGFGNNAHARTLDFPFDTQNFSCFSAKSNEICFGKVYLREYLNSKMSNSVFNECLKNMILLKMGYNQSKIPASEILSNTPLTQAIVALGDVMVDFRKNYSLELSSLVIVHDGDSDDNSVYYDGGGLSSLKYKNSNYVITDKKCNFNYKLDFEIQNPIFRSALEWFRHYTNSKIFSFYISSSNSHRSCINKLYHKPDGSRVESFDSYADVISSTEKLIKELNKNKFLVMNTPGYDDFYLIFGGKDLDARDADVLDSIKDNATSTEIKNAFLKFYKSKSVNRVLVTRFINGIAVE